MRLDRISRLALVASLGLSGCSTYRPTSGLDSYQPLRDAEPPRHATEFNPHGGSQQWNDHRATPGESQNPHPHPPLAPPALGVSRIKSVGLLRDTTAPCADSGTSACSTEGCVTTYDDKPSCLGRVFNKPGKSLKRLFGGDQSQIACGGESCTTSDPCTTEGACAATSGITSTSRTDSLRTGMAADNAVSAPKPGVADQWREDRARLQNHKPSLAEAMHDPFLDLEQNPFSQGVSAFDTFRQSETFDKQPESRNPFDVAEEVYSGHSFTDLHNNSASGRRKIPAANRPSTEASDFELPAAAIPSDTAPGQDVPAAASENGEVDTLPLWPRLRPTPKVTETGLEVRPAVPQSGVPQPTSPQSAAATAAAVRPEAPLPQIIARERL